MKRKIKKYIAKHHLLHEGDKVVVALSGGADSVALLLLLQMSGYDIHAAHCNFHLRGEESVRDEDFVRELCKKRNIELTVFDFDTENYAKKKRLSIEMAARELRYNAFEELRVALGAQAIAVAHHRDDSAETVLLNMLRGTGIKGLHGIRPKNGKIVRPLLCVGRNDIIDFLRREDAAFVTDSTNLQTDYTRNKIRLELIPMMQRINPSIADSIVETAERIAEAERIYDKAVEEGIERVKQGDKISIDALRREPSPTTLLHEILSPLGFNNTHIENICNSMDGNSGRRFYTDRWIVLKDREYFIIYENGVTDCDTRVLLPDCGSVEAYGGTLEITAEPFDGVIPKSSDIVGLDADTLHLPLYLRKIQKGDRFIPFGMRGTKLVSDFLTDRKSNIIEKENQLVVADAENNIVWLVGKRPAAPYCIGKKTKKLLRLKWRRS